VASEPDGKILVPTAPGRDIENQLLLLIGCRDDVDAVQHEERCHCRVPNALVAIDERMVLDQRSTEGCRLVKQSRLKVLPVECHSGLGQR
jgi:hypothetical protein